MGNPTVTPLQEIFHPGGFIVSLANGHRSFDQGTILSGSGKVLPGTVLGKVTTGASATSAALGTNTGNGVFGAVTLTTVPTQPGSYDVAFSDATHFTVTAPDGSTSTGTTGVAFSALGIGFTITAGATPMVAGDGFTIAITQAVGSPTAAASAKAGNTGNATSSAVTTTGYAPILGNYRVTMIKANTNLGTFEVEDPTGQLIGHGVVATAFSGGGISFTIADGATDFVEGDSFVVTVAAGSGKWRPWDPSHVDGSQNVAGIMFGYKDATSADKSAAIVVRSCEVNASELVWPTGMNAATITLGQAGLAALGIIAR
jgi:hypothetical protein